MRDLEGRIGRDVGATSHLAGCPKNEGVIAIRVRRWSSGEPSGTTNESPAPGTGGAWSLGDSTHWSVSRNSVVIAQQFSNLFPGAIQRPYLGPTERLKA